jgi:hypothetical protein
MSSIGCASHKASTANVTVHLRSRVDYPRDVDRRRSTGSRSVDWKPREQSDTELHCAAISVRQSRGQIVGFFHAAGQLVAARAEGTVHFSL